MHKTREQRQDEALMRQLARDNRTPQQQLTCLSRRPGQSRKEIARLLTQSATHALVAPDDDLFVDYDVECSASPDGYHIWRATLTEDMYECEACGLIDC